MPVTDQLDLTPPSTFNTIQFDSELLNVIALSLLTSFTAANIGSFISKLVYLTRGTTFSFDAWLRAYIFANTDDPLRLLSWLLGRYVYRDRSWPRAEQQMRYGRLVLPLLARMAVLITTIATIAIAIPNNQIVSGCEKSDYALRWDPTAATTSDDIEGICQNIPLSSRVGFVPAIASYCTETQRMKQRQLVEDTGPANTETGFQEDQADSSAMLPSYTEIIVNRSVADASFSFAVTNVTHDWAMTFRVEWKDPTQPGALFLSSVNNLTMDEYMQTIARRAVSHLSQGCAARLTKTASQDSLSGRFNCSSDALAVFLRLKEYTKNGLRWERQPKAQLRLKLQTGNDPVFTNECPFKISVSLPLVNILPLTVLLGISMILNLGVSLAVLQHGNVLDAGFHVIKDAFGRDSTSNPLEENKETDEIKTLHLTKYRCALSGGGHVSFIGRDGDDAVEGFDGSVVVGGCVTASKEMRRVLRGGVN